MSELTPKTQFEKGVSGNKRGRPKGSKNKSTILREAMQAKCEGMLTSEVPKVLEVVLDAAKGGDLQAAKMILDRAIPVHKATDGAKEGKGQITIQIEDLRDPYAGERKAIDVQVERLEDSGG